jgi:hypothetical protein
MLIQISENFLMVQKKNWKKSVSLFYTPET